MDSFKIKWWAILLLLMYTFTCVGQRNLLDREFTSTYNNDDKHTINRLQSQTASVIIEDCDVKNYLLTYRLNTKVDIDTTSFHIFKYSQSTIFEFSMGLGSGGNKGVSFASSAAILFPIVKGSRHLIGYSVGLEDLKGRFNTMSFPIGMRYQVYLSDKKSVKPYLYANAGWSLINLNEEIVTFRDANITGFRKEIGMGVSFVNKTADSAWYIRTAYITQALNYELNQNWGWGVTTKIEEELRRIMFSVGLYF